MYQGDWLNFCLSDHRIGSLKDFNRHSPAGQHYVPVQEVHHLVGKEPVDSVLVECKKAFPNDSGLILEVRITFEGMLLSDTDTDMGNFKLTL